MDRAKPFFQFRLRTLFIFTAVVAVLLALLMVPYRVMSTWRKDTFGPVASPEEWPRPLKELLREASDLEIDESTIQVYCLEDFIDSRYIWRMKASPDLFEFLEKHWDLEEAEDTQWPTFHPKLETPQWWWPDENSEPSDLVLRQVFLGDGSEIWVAWDQKRHDLFVYYWFNF